MINVEQFQNENDLFKLEDNCIHSICTVNRRNEKDVDTYVSAVGDYNFQMDVLEMKHH